MGYWLHDPNEYIVRSFLDTDFYKFPMGDFILSNPIFADAVVTFRLKCRTKGIKLGKVIPVEYLERELDHVMHIRPTNSEIYYLRGMDVYGDRMLSEPYLQFLKTIELPAYKLNVVANGELELEFTAQCILWSCLSKSIAWIESRWQSVIKNAVTRSEQFACRKKVTRHSQWCSL